MFEYGIVLSFSFQLFSYICVSIVLKLFATSMLHDSLGLYYMELFYATEQFEFLTNTVTAMVTCVPLKYVLLNS